MEGIKIKHELYSWRKDFNKLKFTGKTFFKKNDKTTTICWIAFTNLKNKITKIETNDGKNWEKMNKNMFPIMNVDVFTDYYYYPCKDAFEIAQFVC